MTTPHSKTVNAKNRLYALGRLPVGVMNQTEARFERHLAEHKLIGAVLWYKFEAIKLRLGDNTFLTVDFAIMHADRSIELCDVKGSKSVFQEDAKAKMRIAASLYPLFRFTVAYPRSRRDGGGWVVEEV
jgi:hypothetical protein